MAATAAKAVATPARSARNGTKTPTRSAAPSSFSKEQELAAYRDMLLIRRFEEKAGQMYTWG